MRKWFKMLSLAALVGMVSACSSDDPAAWEQLPQTEITGSDLSVTVNGVAAQAGSAQFKATDATTGVLTLKNIVPGYNNVPIDVKMEEKVNGTFAFSGEKGLTDAPSRAGEFMTVKVDGTINVEGKMNANISASGVALIIGVYSDDNLVVNGKAAPMGRATIAAESGTDGVVTLANVVPGYPVVPFTVQFVDNGNGAVSFSALAELTDAPSRAGVTENATPIMSVELKGSVDQSGKANITVNSQLTATAQAGLTGTWNLTKNILDPESYTEFDTAPVRVIWTPKDESQVNGTNISMLGTRVGSNILAEVLNSITLNADGTLSASYYPAPILDKVRDNNGEWVNLEGELTDNMIQLVFGWLAKTSVDLYPREWITSPDNLMYWYAKDGYIYLQPSIVNIINQVSADKGEAIDVQTIMEIINNVQNMTPEEMAALLGQLKEMIGVDLTDVAPQLLPQILGWFKTGVPLKYTNDNGNLNLYIDKEMADPFMAVAFKFLPLLQAKFNEAAASNPMLMFVPGLLGLQQFTDLETIWNTNTEEFRLGINFSDTKAKASAKSTIASSIWNEMEAKAKAYAK